MGAWSYGVFDDDTAYEFTADIHEGDAVRFFNESFTAALNADYVGIDEAHAVTVSAAYIDAILNGTHYGHDEQETFDTFVIANKNLPVGDLKPLAMQALEKVMGIQSELAEVWMDNALLYPKWKESLTALITRLET